VLDLSSTLLRFLLEVFSCGHYHLQGFTSSPSMASPLCRTVSLHLICSWRSSLLTVFTSLLDGPTPFYYRHLPHTSTTARKSLCTCIAHRVTYLLTISIGYHNLSAVPWIVEYGIDAFIFSEHLQQLQVGRDHA
jgi:hypothetical protein